MLSLTSLLQTEGVRHPTALDYLPLWMGEQLLPKPDYDWIWVLQKDGAIGGALVAAPCHGLVMLLRLINYTSDPTVTRGLLKAAAQEILDRGYKAFFLMANRNRLEEASILQQAEHFGLATDPELHTLMGGPIPCLHSLSQ